MIICVAVSITAYITALLIVLRDCYSVVLTLIALTTLLCFSYFSSTYDIFWCLLHRLWYKLTLSFTKILPGLPNLPYTKRLEVLGIDSLETRRLRYDLVFVYKMLFGLVDLKFSDYFTLRINSTTRGHDYKLFLAYSRMNVRKHFVSERVVSVWNNLENNVINFSNIKCFKRSLLCCNVSRYTHF